METIIFIIAITTIVFATISRRIEKTWVTPPMVFTTLGTVLALTIGRLIDEAHPHRLLEFIAQITLVVVLFIDASRIRSNVLVRDYKIPVRMLGVGLPLTIVLGTLIGLLVFPELSFWEAALLSAILAPTDAALGQAVVSSPDVPPAIRQSLNVESGLNDGIALPLVILFATLAAITSDASVGSLMLYWFQQVTFGPRGLASLLFALLATSRFDLVNGNVIFDTAILTVVLSIFAHSFTAVPASRWYKGAIDKLCGPESLERKPCGNIAPRYSSKPSTLIL